MECDLGTHISSSPDHDDDEVLSNEDYEDVNDDDGNVPFTYDEHDDDDEDEDEDDGEDDDEEPPPPAQEPLPPSPCSPNDSPVSIIIWW